MTRLDQLLSRIEHLDHEATKGPWHIWKVDQSHWCICEVPNDNRHSHFAEVNVGNCWHKEGEANAELMAEAREVLPLLAKIVQEMQAWCDDFNRDDLMYRNKVDEIAEKVLGGEE